MKIVQVGVRFPADVKAWLEDQARINRSSQNSEVIRSIRERMKAAGEDLGGHAPAAGTDRKTNHRGAHDHAGE